MSSQRMFLSATAACIALALPAAAFAAVAVHIDEVTPISVGGQISRVIVGNPSIADVSLMDRRHIMILGRTYGVTNIMALDGVGRVIFQTTVNVAPAATGRVSLFRGTEPNDYACNDRCVRTPMPNKSQPNYKNYDPNYSDYINRAKSSATPSGNP